MWKSSDQVQGYLAIKDMLPPETKVFPMCMPDSSIIGLDKLSFPWDGDVVSFRDSVAGKSPAEIHSFLKEKGYGYVILDISCVFNCVEAGGNSDACISKVNEIAKGMSDSGLFASAWSNSAVLLYKLK